MANNRQLILRSPVLDDVVKRHLKERTEPRRPGRNSLDNIGGMNFSTAGKLSHQFKIMASDTNTITVLNGNAPNSFSAGSLNGVEYARKDITFSSGIYYIYAVDGNVYALKHRFHSDLIPALLIGVVTVAGGMVTIEQRNFSDNPVVPVCGAVYGATELGYSITYANYALTVKYTVASKIAVNNVVIELTATDIPTTAEGKDGYLYGYVKSLTVDYNTTPEGGIVFSADLPEERQWVQTVFSYRLHDNTFRVLSRMENPQNFVFAPFPLNAVEVGV